MSAVTIGDITYVGGVENVTQRKQPQFSLKDTYEIDRATLTLQAAPDNARAYVDGLGRGAVMSFLNGSGSTETLSKMWLQKASCNDDASNSEIALQFAGFRDGSPPPPQYDNYLISSSVSVTRDTGGGSQTLTYRYRSARSTITYWRDEEPDPEEPEFDATFDTTDPLVPERFIGRSISGVAGSSIAFADFIALFDLLAREMQVSDYRITPVIPDKLWSCSVNVEYVLVGT